ncbi:alpha/beta hydrolase [Hymenobacter sp. 5516J-16]|uniref:alpha/beta fold hydrolase n=1 Tax=Hymenobacter sp. 5516J-16 TaxID=2932253 RepID=UPI001FCFBA8A|nr:alpha/beta hydrolase [Hymenobacter sp. 5516J-16]UOQ78907.1 alpha/beta hydrolase [Hymenobacter sp. 5516J-16]
MPAVLPALTFIGLHYWAGSGRAFQPVADLLAPDYPLLAPDLLGFGAAPEPAVSSYSVGAYARQVESFIAENEVGRYVLVGHSMGGKIALALAAHQPAGLVGVALLSPSPPSPEPMTDADRMASLRAYGKRPEAEKTFQKITARTLPEPLHQQILDDNLRSTRLAWDAWLLHGSREDLSAQMGNVRVPCTIIVGDQDDVMSPSVHGLETLPLLPVGTPLEIIGGAGHLLPYEAPEEVAELLRAFAHRL